MALLRIKRPEHLKERDPAAFGRLLGLDRAPEVKTLRRRLTRLAAYHRAEQLGAELARLRVDQRGHFMGFLYVDGHVRAYHGHRAGCWGRSPPCRHRGLADDRATGNVPRSRPRSRDAERFLGRAKTV
jgi:prepilin-type processing-associated H-X9-DG protein